MSGSSWNAVGIFQVAKADVKTVVKNEMFASVEKGMKIILPVELIRF
jgi:hypothetical protein